MLQKINYYNYELYRRLSGNVISKYGDVILNELNKGSKNKDDFIFTNDMLSYAFSNLTFETLTTNQTLITILEQLKVFLYDPTTNDGKITFDGLKTYFHGSIMVDVLVFFNNIANDFLTITDTKNIGGDLQGHFEILCKKQIKHIVDLKENKNE